MYMDAWQSHNCTESNESPLEELEMEYTDQLCVHSSPLLKNGLYGLIDWYELKHMCPLMKPIAISVHLFIGMLSINPSFNLLLDWTIIYTFGFSLK